MASTAAMNQPPFSNKGEQPPDASPQDPTWAETGVYVEPTYRDLSASGIPPAPGTELPSLAPQLSEQNYAPGRAASSDVDPHVYHDQYHGLFYGEDGPRPFPN